MNADITISQLLACVEKLQQDVEKLKRWQQEAAQLYAHQIKWVTDKQAQEITGLSRRTLLRERQKLDSLIVWKADHGTHYDYESLLRHNESRAIGRGRMRQYYAPPS